MMSTELDKTPNETPSSSMTEREIPSNPHIEEHKERLKMIWYRGLKELTLKSPDEMWKYYWFISHHGGFSHQETTESHIRPHQEMESREFRERQIEILQERCDKLSTQNQFLQTRNAELRQSVAELRKAVARETQKFDQMQGQSVKLQQTVDKLVDCINDRGRSSDCLLSSFISRPDSRIRMTQSYEGVVEDLHDDRVVVVYDVDGKIVEQTYERNQFNDHRLPEVGMRLAVYVIVAEVQPKPYEPDAEELDPDDESSHYHRKSLRGPTEF